MWEKILNNMDDIPTGKVLATSKQGEMLIGHIFSDSDSSTGYVCHSIDDAEIECIAYCSLHKQKWHKHTRCIPINRLVVAKNVDGDTIVGKLRHADNGTLVAEDEMSTLHNVTEWFIPKSYIDITTYRKINNIIALAAMFFFGIIVTNIVHPRYVLFENMPKDTRVPYAPDMSFQLMTEKDATDTAQFIEAYGGDAITDFQFLTLQGFFQEDFNEEAFYIDEQDNWHYVDHYGRLYCGDDKGSYVIDPTKHAAYYIEDYYLSFITDSDEMMDSKSDLVPAEKQMAEDPVANTFPIDPKELTDL